MVDNTWIFDSEVFRFDWLFTFKSVDTGEYIRIWNDSEALTQYLEDDPFLGGFNNKKYDNFIIKAILIGCTTEQIKHISDEIVVKQKNGWDIPLLREYKVSFHWFDLLDDCQSGVSLKGIEAHLGLPIRESTVDFNIDRPLTEDERREVEKYCQHDVDTTELLYKLRQGYLANKKNLALVRGIDVRDGISMTNAKITATYLQAVKPEKPWTDERDYHYPDKLLKDYIPKEVFSFFDRLHDPNVPDDEMFEKNLELMIGDCPATIGFGGIHAAIPTYTEEATETRSIRNKDVASYYPHLMTIPLSEGQEYGYCSRNIPSPKIYSDTLEDRVKAKKAGDKDKANALKLVLNTTYGALLNGNGETAYNNLYDPLMGRSVCITGQLLLLELTNHLLAECPTLKVIQLNTDGIMVSFDNSDEPKWQEITKEWEQRTGFELEEDFIRKIVQKDVNNYIEIPVKGEPKLKGGALVRGILTNGNVDFTQYGLLQWNNLAGGAWKINNDAVVISNAIQEYFINGTDPEQTIKRDHEILHFQIISKVGSKYKSCYQVIDGEKVPVQKVNRVYAVDDMYYGTIYKTHAKTGRDAKVGGLPEHCLVDNENHLVVGSIDKEWYIRQARKYIRDFLGVKPPKRNTRKVNLIKKEILKILEEE